MQNLKKYKHLLMLLVLRLHLWKKIKNKISNKLLSHENTEREISLEHWISYSTCLSYTDEALSRLELLCRIGARFSLYSGFKALMRVLFARYTWQRDRKVSQCQKNMNTIRETGVRRVQWIWTHLTQRQKSWKLWISFDIVKELNA